MARRRTAQLDLECLAQLRWSDLPPELRKRLGDLLANLLEQVAASGAIAETRDDQ
jgi:hypothetical protein